MRWACGHDGNLLLARPDLNATCPCCDEDVVSKCGKIVVWHWAHKSRADCDTWAEPETEWHAAWKSRYERTEVVIDGTVNGLPVRHRADAVSAVGGRDTVVEFQHSTLESAEVQAREEFYGDMIWVIDGCEPYRKGRLTLGAHEPSSGTPYYTFRWNHRRRSFDDCRSPVFIDLGVSWIPVGRPFWKEKRWWDDGGLRDGYMREPGWWQRTVRFAAILEIRKHDEGRGWGRIVSHKDFCARTGAANCTDSETPILHGLCSQAWEGGFRCLASRVHGVPEVDPRLWCQQQLSHARMKFIKEEVL